MREVGILTGTDPKGDQIFAATYDGDDGPLMSLVGSDGSLSETFDDLVELDSIVITTTAPVQLLSVEEVMQMAVWFERAAMWLAMKEELGD